MLENNPKFQGAFRPMLSHWIRKNQDQNGSGRPLITSDTLKAILNQFSIPTPKEQANNLIRYAGDTLRDKDPAGWVHSKLGPLAAIIGARDADGVHYIIKDLKDKRLLDSGIQTAGLGLQLTPTGWEAYEELRRSHNEGPIAFMAMQFGDDEIATMFLDCFKPAVWKTGFDLRRLDEEPSAGLIDNRMRVEIRKSRFLIADLTKENRGAYWEAGFAEGLGKPVIYTCQREWWDQHKTHFDTNHHHTIIWDSADKAQAEEQLKVTIRATLPGEARLSDPPPEDTE